MNTHSVVARNINEAKVSKFTRTRLVAAAAFLILLQASLGRAAIPGASTDLSLLVITAQTNDYSLAPIREALDFAGVKYDVHVAAETPGSLTAAKLQNGPRGFYNGIILTSVSLGYTSNGGITWQSALDPTEWATLEQYERDFGVRRLNWYGFPSPNEGFNWPSGSTDTSTSGINAQWTAAGAQVFPYLNTQNTFPITNVWTYLATPLDANTTVWLDDGQGNALLASAVRPDGREVATMTFDSATWLVSCTVLRHGLISWVSKGMFLGQRHTYVVAQVDDVLIPDDIYTGGEYRQNSNDWHATITWQQNYRQRPSGVNFRYDMAYNGQGTDPALFPNDDLIPYVKATEGEFKWISHTYSHPYLTYFTYEQAMVEILPNNQIATELGLTDFTPINMVTPNITGLENPSFLNAAYDAGIRYLVSDTSIPLHRPDSPNTGIPNWHVPGILMIPRHANNMFYNVSTPQQWELEYNAIFNSYWGRDLTYAEIIEDQSDLIVGRCLKGDVSPWMFHQPNLRDYDGQGSTMLGDLLDRVADKYEYYYNFPFLSPRQHELGQTLEDRMAYNDSGVVATRNADGSVTLSVTNAATIPVTGMKTDGGEFYAGQWIAYVTLGTGQSVTLVPDTNGNYQISAPPANTAPTADDASYTVAAGSVLPITLSGSDPENDPLTYTVTSNPTLGTLTGVAPNVTYVPPVTATGTDTFQFSVSDGEFTSTATVTINVAANQNNAPTANDTTITTPVSTPVTVTVSGTDPDGDELTFAIVSTPSLGDIEIDDVNPNLITYNPTPGLSGTDTFLFTASDGQLSSTGTVTMIIEAPAGTNVTVSLDGQLNEWTEVPNAGSGVNVPNTPGNDIDLVELKVTHDDNNLYIAYHNENPITLNWGYNFYLDTDRNPNTGFAMWQSGADYVIQGNTLYAYAGNGTDWNWTFVTVLTAAAAGNIVEMSLPRSALGTVTEFHYLFYGDNTAFGGPDIEFIPASALTGGQSYLRYNFVPSTDPIQIDGDLSDWTGAPLATDPDDVTGAANPLDLLELRLTNDANKYYLAYVNDGPITLNWGYTLYLDTDAQANTGFSYWSIGADYVIQGGDVYQYTGTGSDWSWTWVGSMETTVNGNIMEAAFEKTFLGNTASTIRAIFYGDNTAFGGTATDVAPQNLGGNPGHLTYTVQ